MTRRRDLMCEDIFGCKHEPEIPIIEDDAIIGYLCRCGKRLPVKNKKEEKRDDE